MSYQVFKDRVNSLIRHSKTGITVRFKYADGKFFANCSDGTTIVGNPVSSRVQIQWGSGHKAIAKI